MRRSQLVVILVIFLHAVDHSSSAGPRVLSIAGSDRGGSRGNILFRINRQAEEESYEEGAEYEYEEEEDGGKRESESPKVEKGEAEEEYYEEETENGQEGEEEEEEKTTPPPPTTTTTTTTTTTAEPDHEMEGIEDEDHYEERYEAERRRYEEETMRQQWENTHGREEVEAEEEEEEERRRQQHRQHHEEDHDTDEVEEPSTEATTTTTTPVPEVEEEEVEEEEEEVTTTTTTPLPPQGENEIEAEAEVEAVERGEGTHSSVEIQESGRHDLERYEEERHDTGEGSRSRYNGERPEEEEVEYEEEEENEDRDHVEYTTSTTTTTTSTTTTPPPPTHEEEEEEEVYGRRRDPEEYEVEPPPPPPPPRREEEHENEEYYEEGESEKEEEVEETTTTTTTTTPEPVIEEVEEVEEEEETPPPDPRENEVQVDLETETGRGGYGHGHTETETETETLDYGEEEEEEIPPHPATPEPPTTTTTTTTTPIPYPVPYEPEEEYDEEEDDEEIDRFPIPTTTTTTTPTPTTIRTMTEPPALPELEDNDLYKPVPFASQEEEEEEEEEERRVDQARNQYEISPVLPTEQVIIEEIVPKIECFSGYTLSSDGQECVDIDECRSDGSVCGSQQACHNLPGSYECTCPLGYIVDPRNAKNCRDFNECQSLNGGCDQDCINVPGSFYCACADDFDLSSDRKKCIRRATTTTTTTTTTPPPTTTTSTTTTTTTPAPTTTTTFVPPIQRFIPTTPAPGGGTGEIRNCPTPPVPRGTGIAYLYCSRSPVGIHHRHSQLERRLLHDWAARRNRTQFGGRGPRFRSRRNLLRRKLRQTTYSPGSLCELRCRPGFELKGQYSLSCNSSDGTWQGTRNGYCQAIPKGEGVTIGSGVEPTPSNEIPRLPEVGFRPNFITTTTFRPTYYQPPPPAPTFSRPRPTVGTTATTTTTTTTPTTTTTISPQRPNFWTKPPPPARRPYYFSPSASTIYGNNVFTRPFPHGYTTPISTTTTTSTTTQPTMITTGRNSYNIHLTYRYKSPWIKCPEDIRMDLPPGQNTAYVVIPQPQTNVDWWRQVTAEPGWAKGLESESGPGKQRITFRARTAAPVNNTAECSLTLEVRDKEPPRVRECPESFSVRLASGQVAEPVKWTEPTFTDNVRITALKKSHEPGTVLSAGEHLIHYEAKDSSDNKARCSFTITVLPPAGPAYTHYSSNTGRNKPGLDGISGSTSTTTSTSPKPEVHSAMRNVVCYVGKKGRRIVFQSRVVPRGCSEMSTDIAADSSGGRESFNTLNTITQNSAENSATSQISSVSFTSHDHPQQASAFSQSVSNGRNNNRLVHSTSSVTNGQHGTSSKASSYAISVSASSRNFDLPFFNPQVHEGSNNKQVYEDDFVVPEQPPPSQGKGKAGVLKIRSGSGGGGSTREESGGYKYGSTAQPKNGSGKYFRHFDTWDTTTDSYSFRNRE